MHLEFTDSSLAVGHMCPTPLQPITNMAAEQKPSSSHTAENERHDLIIIIIFLFAFAPHHLFKKMPSESCKTNLTCFDGYRCRKTHSKTILRFPMEFFNSWYKKYKSVSPSMKIVTNGFLSACSKLHDLITITLHCMIVKICTVILK